MQTVLTWCYIPKRALGRLSSLEEARRRLGEITGPSAIVAEHDGTTDEGEPAFFFKLTDRMTALLAREIAAYPDWRMLSVAPRWERTAPAGSRAGGGLLRWPRLTA